MASRGEYCCVHDVYFAPRLGCAGCREETERRRVKDHLRLVTYEEWLKNHQVADEHA